MEERSKKTGTSLLTERFNIIILDDGPHADLLIRDNGRSDRTEYYADDMVDSHSRWTRNCSYQDSSREISRLPSRLSRLSKKAKRHHGQVRGCSQTISLLRSIGEINVDVYRRLGDQVEGRSDHADPRYVDGTLHAMTGETSLCEVCAIRLCYHLQYTYVHYL
jgi:hypothetical protein